MEATYTRSDLLDWQPYTSPNECSSWQATSLNGSYTIEDQTSAPYGGDWILTAIVQGALYVTHFDGIDAGRKAFMRAEELEVQSYG